MFNDKLNSLKQNKKINNNINFSAQETSEREKCNKEMELVFLHLEQLISDSFGKDLFQEAVHYKQLKEDLQKTIIAAVTENIPPSEIVNKI